MDASAYLRRQGWRGDGHSLDHTNRGIKKPLLLGKKKDVLGVGLDKHAAVSDQWWLRAFDQGLKRLGTGEQTILGQVQKHGVKRGDLYGRFVKGEQIPGSIGQSLLPTPDDSDAPSAHTPIASQQEHQAKMKNVDVPPQDKLERVVGSQDDQRAHDAMMHVLQNPGDAPAGMEKMLDRKRKRAERPVEKRARRKTEQSENSRAGRDQIRRQAIEDGTRHSEEEREEDPMEQINQRANELVLEAQRQGLIPAGPNEIRKGLIPTGANATAMQGQTSTELQEILAQAGLTQPMGRVNRSLKAQKYAREKAKRELKRAAKTYLMAEAGLHRETKEERKARKEQDKQRKAERRARIEREEAERLAAGTEKADAKAMRREARKAEKANIDRIIAARRAVSEDGDAVIESNTNGEANAGNDFDNGADEVMFNMNSHGGAKKIPGIVIVDRYPTKAEKKKKKLQATAIRNGISEEKMQARIEEQNEQKLADESLKVDKYRAMKHGMSLSEYRNALANGEVHHPWVERRNLPPEKLAEYQKRAEQKGMNLQDYIKRRAEKRAEKLSETLGHPFQQDMIYAASDGEGGPGFVIDTEGDEQLLAKKQFSSQAIAAISSRTPLAIADDTGNETFRWEPSMPIPLDPRIWEGQEVKTLPKPIRKARQQWMRKRREERKANEVQAGKKPPPRKAKGERKVEAHERFVRQILNESRRHAGRDNVMVTIDGVANVPLVKVRTGNDPFNKLEVSLARTVARRVLRNVKREEKAKKGRGEGWKKKERSAKEAARNAGISGFTDVARVDSGGGVNADLLL